MHVSSQGVATLGPYARPRRLVEKTRSASIAAPRTGFLTLHLKKIGVAAFFGVLAGFLAAGAISQTSTAREQVVYAVAERAPSTPAVAQAAVPAAADAEELARLRSQNEELLTLVANLRKQAPHTRAVHAKSHARGHRHSR